MDGYIASARALFPRYARLGFMLMGVYVVSGLAFLVLVVRRDPGEGWSLTALMTVAFVLWITVVNLLYLLVQIVVAADDCSVATAARRVAAFLRQERGDVGRVFLLVLALIVGATGASVLATAALGLVAFVPFVGLAALPLQLLAWLLRGLVFQYLGLTSVGAYLKLYRGRSLGRRLGHSTTMTDLRRSFCRQRGVSSANPRSGGWAPSSRVEPDMVSFAAGYPDPASFPWEELREIARELLSGADPHVLQYGPTRGYAPLLESIVAVLAQRHITATPDELLITSGSQQGIDLVGARAGHAGRRRPRRAACVHRRDLGLQERAGAARRRQAGRRRDQPRRSRRGLHARAPRRTSGQPAVPGAELSESRRACCSASRSGSRLLEWAERRESS